MTMNFKPVALDFVLQRLASENLGLIVLLLAGATVLLAAACLYIFLSSRKQSRVVCGRESDAVAFNERMSELAKTINSLNLRLEEIERRQTITIDGSAEPASVNLNRRGQVLRLSRRGDSAGQIASALGLSQGEVKLTLRVHQMVLDNSEREISAQTL